MNLHKAMLNDVSRVFLNPEEFGEEIIFNGHPVIALIDDGHGTWEGDEANSLNNTSGLGLMQQGRIMRLPDMQARPVPGQRVTINGEVWQVDEGDDSVTVETGILCLKLHRAYA